MRLYYNGIDITDDVKITGAVGYDMSGGSCDNIIVELDEARKWYGWKPQTDDVLEIVNGEYSSGRMYLNAVFPRDDVYRIMATAIPSTARNRDNAAYYDMTIGEIAAACAVQSCMDSRIYGIESEIRYDCVMRTDESIPAFLERIAKRENAVLKCWNGRYMMIGIEAAQDIEATQNVFIRADQTGVYYMRRNDEKIRRYTVASVAGEYTAVDDSAEGDLRIVSTCLPVTQYDQTIRWSRGILTDHNRRAETMRIGAEFNAGWTAMARIDISGETDANGEWIIDNVRHDFVNLTSEAMMYRVIRTVH